MVFLTCLYNKSSETTTKQGPESLLEAFHVTLCVETRGECGEAARRGEKDSWLRTTAASACTAQAGLRKGVVEILSDDKAREGQKGSFSSVISFLTSSQPWDRAAAAVGDGDEGEHLCL